MRVALLIALILLAPCALADGWYYAGETWTEDGVVYSLEGSDYETALLGIGGPLHVLSLYECKTIGLSEYCYTESAYPDDDDHIKYEAGEELFGYYITIETFAPDIEITRELSDNTPEFGESTKMTVTLLNDGDYRVSKLRYEEEIPEGLTIVNGPRKGSRIIWEQLALNVGEQYRFTYNVRADEFGEFDLEPLVTYEYETTKYNQTPSKITIDVDFPVTVERYISDSLNIDEKGKYNVNISNDGEETLTVDLSLTTPEGIEVIKVEGLTQIGRTLSKEYTLDEDEEEEILLEFYVTSSGTLTLPLNVTTRSAGATASETFSDSVSSSGGLIVAQVLVSPTRNAYPGGTEVTISGVLENENDDVRFESIEGRLESELFRTVTFAHEGFPPGKKLTEAQVVAIMPDEEKEFPITFKGTYTSPRGKEYSFSEETSVKVVPQGNTVEVTRTLDPQKPEPGENVTISVSLKNLVETYTTLDVHEKYPAGFEKTSGLSYAEMSLEKDESKQAYIYQLKVPDDFTGTHFNITTSILVKDADFPEEVKTTVWLEEVAEEVEEVVENETPVVAEELPEEEKELGFFASIWDFIKKLFD